MANSGLPQTKLFLENKNDFIQCSYDEKIGNLINLIRNSYEPILVFEGENFKGLISIQKIILNSKLPYLSKAVNKIVETKPIRPTTNILKVLKQMLNYGWYRMPIFNNKNQIVGQLSVKKVLKALIDNNIFRRLIILKTKIREPILISNEAEIKDVLKILRDGESSYGFMINRKGRYVGAVGKDSLLKAFNKKVESKRFDTKPGSMLNNIYVGEKIDRDNYPLKRYIKRRMFWSSARETDRKKIVIQKLVNSKFNTIVILNKDKIPVGILETKDLLESILIKDKTGNLPLKLVGFDQLSNLDSNIINKMIAKLYKFTNKKDKVKKIELSNKEIKSIKGKTNIYEIRLKISLYSGKVYLAHDKSRSLNKGVRKTIDEVRGQIA